MSILYTAQSVWPQKSSSDAEIFSDVSLYVLTAFDWYCLLIWYNVLHIFRHDLLFAKWSSTKKFDFSNLIESIFVNVRTFHFLSNQLRQLIALLPFNFLFWSFFTKLSSSVYLIVSFSANLTKKEKVSSSVNKWDLIDRYCTSFGSSPLMLWKEKNLCFSNDHFEVTCIWWMDRVLSHMWRVVWCWVTAEAYLNR